jgi:hypothetical protein
VGLRAARGDLLFLLNQDTRVHPGWLAALTGTLADPAVGLAGCKLLYPDGTIQHAGGFMYGPRGESDHLGRNTPDDGHFDRQTDVDYATGAALAIRRSVFNQIGPLDEGFAPAYYEDVDWCYRGRAAGYRVVYQPQAVVTHVESTAIDPDSYERKCAIHQGRLRFLFKHWPLDRLLYEFGPAERAWVLSMERNEELMAARRAYLHTLLALASILAYRGSCAAEADGLVGLLSDLRFAAAAGLVTRPSTDKNGELAMPSVEASQDGERTRLLELLRENQVLREHTFSSQVPVFGPLIATVRTLWNSVATKWYVRPVFHQQSVFNAHLLGYLQLLERRLQGQSLDVAENIRELTTLAEQLASVQKPENQRGSGG